jgi:predicted TIM-barrel fold metal-dependent hydrolase
MNLPSQRRIVDAHLHLFDHDANHYEFLERVDPTFQALKAGA